MDRTQQMLILHSRQNDLPTRVQARQVIDDYVASLRRKNLTNAEICEQLATFFSYDDAPYARITIDVINEVMDEVEKGTWKHA